MKKPKEVLFIDMSVDEQTNAAFRHAFDGLVKDGLEGLRRGIWVYFLTLKNQQHARNQAQRVTRRP